jgi:LysR family transcriptional activator of nhaA
VREAATAPTLRLAVGISDGLPKLVVHRCLEPVLTEPHLRLLCHEGEFEDLLADLALHRLDVVLADRPAPVNPSLRLHSQVLGSTPMAWYAPPAWAEAAAARFPQSLGEVPVLLPTAHAIVRSLLDRWFERQGVRPRVVGEFEDSALLTVFGAGGMGVFPAPQLVEAELAARYGVVRVGRAEGVDETLYAINAQKRVSHPLVRRLMPGAA